MYKLSGAGGRQVGSRRKSRERALQTLYKMDIAAPGLPRSLESDIDLTVPDEGGGDEYSGELVRGVIDKLTEIDDRIERCSEHWRIDRIAVVDRNVLRIAVYELLYRPRIPYRVVIDEAIEVAKTFGTVDSGAFVNGLLDELHNNIRSDNN